MTLLPNYATEGGGVTEWLIEVGNGYGSFLLEGTEAEAEEMRAHKARWEQAVAWKFRLVAQTEPPERGGVPE